MGFKGDFYLEVGMATVSPLVFRLRLHRSPVDALELCALVFSLRSKLWCWMESAPALGVGEGLGPLTLKIELRLGCLANMVKKRFLE